MKESRKIIIILIIMGIILIPLLHIFRLCGVSSDLSINIIANLGCGVIVGLVTAICQYYEDKKRIINSVYGLYFELYNTYYTCKSKEFLKHYNAISVFKKMTEVSPKINEALSDYHGFFKNFTKNTCKNLESHKNNECNKKREYSSLSLMKNSVSVDYLTLII